MEILVTIIAFWLILVGAYGAYSLRQERGRERMPKVRPQRAVNLTPSPSGASPFGPVSLPAETVPSFITRAAPLRVDPLPAAHAEARNDIDVPDRFRAEKIVAARLKQSATATYDATGVIRSEEPSYDESRYQQPHVAVQQSPREAEVGFLRAQVDHLRTEINALHHTEKPARSERPQQRRYRTGNYTHLPRTLRRQVNEARGFRRFFQF